MSAKSNSKSIETPNDREIPPDVFETLVAGWAEILVSNYVKRHPESDLAPVPTARII